MIKGTLGALHYDLVRLEDSLVMGVYRDAAHLIGWMGNVYIGMSHVDTMDG
jgi:hypothetical protein